MIRETLWKKHDSIRETTISLLYRRNLATKKGLVKIDKLHQDFQDRYLPTQLKQFITDLSGRKQYDWIISLCRDGQNTVIPIRFILFADFLADKLELYINLIKEQQQFIEKEKYLYQPPDGYEYKLVQYRKRWIDARNKTPNGSRFDMVKVDRAAYTWLRRHDNDWMLKNSPQARKPKGVNIFNDWARVDDQLEDLVINAVNRIKKLDGKPERVTKTNICRYIGHMKMIQKNYKWLPKTMLKMDQYIESTYEYRLRKIEWATKELEKDGKPTIPWRILRKAGIRNEDWILFKGFLIPNM